jgi:N-formylglutamate deformylase
MNFETVVPAFRFVPGHRPLLISMPHVGTHLPDCMRERLTKEAITTPDTDWHLERLYDFAGALGVSLLVATHSRYVIDLNRPPDGSSLYPGQSVTGLCPTDTFSGGPLYLSPANQPDQQEVALRRKSLWEPYHAQIAAELARMKAQHGVAALWDAHSIRSHVPRFFEGRLPDLNLGTADGASCDPKLAATLLEIGQRAQGYTAVLNGRFKGGHITRSFGAPLQGIHAIQLEMAQCVYMKEDYPFEYQPSLAAGIQPHLRRMLEATLDFVESLSSPRA